MRRRRKEWVGRLILAREREQGHSASWLSVSWLFRFWAGEAIGESLHPRSQRIRFRIVAGASELPLHLLIDAGELLGARRAGDVEVEDVCGGDLVPAAGAMSKNVEECSEGAVASRGIGVGIVERPLRLDDADGVIEIGFTPGV